MVCRTCYTAFVLTLRMFVVQLLRHNQTTCPAGCERPHLEFTTMFALEMALSLSKCKTFQALERPFTGSRKGAEQCVLWRYCLRYVVFLKISQGVQRYPWPWRGCIWHGGRVLPSQRWVRSPLLLIDRYFAHGTLSLAVHECSHHSCDSGA